MFGGQSVYGILRAPRTASTEAIVLSAPYRPPDDENPKNNHAIALLIALAKAFRRKILLVAYYHFTNCSAPKMVIPIF